MYGFTNIFLIFAPEIGVKGIFSICKSTEIFPIHLIFPHKINAIRKKSDRKMKKSFSKIASFKSTDNGPMSCQNKSSSKIRKYLNKKIGPNNNEIRMKKNNSALNIKVNSK